MPLFTAHPPPSYFFSLEPFVEVALMSVVGRAADNLKCRHLIFSCYNLRFFFSGVKKGCERYGFVVQNAVEREGSVGKWCQPARQ